MVRLRADEDLYFLYFVFCLESLHLCFEDIILCVELFWNLPIEALMFPLGEIRMYCCQRLSYCTLAGLNFAGRD